MSDNQKAYRERQKTSGVIKMCVMIPEADRDRLLAYAERKRREFRHNPSKFDAE